MVRNFALIVLATLLAGCGNSADTIPVRGKVTLDGGSLPTAGTVYFTPIEAFGSHPLRPASANFDADGNYSVFSFEHAEGLFPGKYRVHVHCWKVPPTMDGPREQSYLPSKYERPHTSDLTLTIEENSSAKEFNIDINSES